MRSSHLSHPSTLCPFLVFLPPNRWMTYFANGPEKKHCLGTFSSRTHLYTIPCKISIPRRFMKYEILSYSHQSNSFTHTPSMYLNVPNENFCKQNYGKLNFVLPQQWLYISLKVKFNKCTVHCPLNHVILITISLAGWISKKNGISHIATVWISKLLTNACLANNCS